MKKLIGIVFIGLMFCNIGFAEIKLIEEKLIKGELYNYTVSTICIDGYKFAIHKSSSGSNMVQFYEWNGLTLEEKGWWTTPARC